MPIRPLAVLVGLLAVIGPLTGCSDEKKGEPSQLSKPAPASDPTRPDGRTPEPPKPTTDKPGEKY